MVVNLLHNLASIKNKLEKEGLMFVNLDISDIIVIDSSKFLFINYNNIYELDKKEIVVDKVLKLSDLNEKSIKEIDEIPFRISIKSVYYNIANLLVYCLFNTVYKDEETINPIYYTKLYWFLTRCLNNNRDDRVFIYLIYMSIATLKKKSRVVYGERVNSPTVSQNGFSLNGIKRIIGTVGPTNLAKSVTRTPFKGAEPKGHGGGKPCRLSGRFARTCGSSGYPKIVSNSGSCSTSQTLIKLSTKNTKGMIDTKYKWIHSAYPRYWVHEVNKINDAGQYTEE